jgi:hypothetical protein
VVVVIYLALAVTVALVLRSMARRFRRQAEDAESAEMVDTDVPYGPRELPTPAGAGSDATTTPGISDG